MDDLPNRPIGSLPTGPSKADLRRTLAEALANTAALQEGRPPPFVPGKKAPQPAKATPVEPQRAAGAPNDRLDAIVAQTQANAPAPPVGRPRAAPVKSKPKYPTADHVAAAIVAACRECREDPLLFLPPAGWKVLRARHYAMHALEHCFPGLPASFYARMVGATVRPGWFMATSRMTIIAAVPGTNRRRAVWWSEAAYGRTIGAIERVAR